MINDNMKETLQYVNNTLSEALQKFIGSPVSAHTMKAIEADLVRAVRETLDELGTTEAYTSPVEFFTKAEGSRLTVYPKNIYTALLMCGVPNPPHATVVLDDYEVGDISFFVNDEGYVEAHDKEEAVSQDGDALSRL
mgnify:CR=1 FL=1